MCVKSGAEPRGNGMWILGGHGLYLFCPVVAAAAACLHGALWWPYHALYPAPSPLLFYKFLTQKSALSHSLGW